MFKLFTQTPTAEDHITELCDYLEVKSILSADNKISVNEIVKEFQKPADEEDYDGIDDYADIIRQKIELVSFECQRRAEASGNKYPFELEYHGEVIRFNGLSDNYSFLYVYLLFATRLDMNKNKKLKNIDGTKILEMISSEISKSYFGNKSQSFVVGTSMRGGFKYKVNELCKLIGEGIQFVNANEGPVDENDGGLDIVVWIDFSDKNPSKFLAFGQCKTGTNWEKHIKELDPEAFCKLWFSKQPVLTPLRIFFIADVLQRERWYKTVVYAGLFFDRLRLVDYMPETIPDELLSSLQTWTSAAIEITSENIN
jgi:hypothetical protein